MELMVESMEIQIKDLKNRCRQVKELNKALEYLYKKLWRDIDNVTYEQMHYKSKLEELNRDKVQQERDISNLRWQLRRKDEEIRKLENILLQKSKHGNIFLKSSRVDVQIQQFDNPLERQMDEKKIELAYHKRQLEERDNEKEKLMNEIVRLEEHNNKYQQNIKAEMKTLTDKLKTAEMKLQAKCRTEKTQMQDIERKNRELNEMNTQIRDLKRRLHSKKKDVNDSNLQNSVKEGRIREISDKNAAVKQPQEGEPKHYLETSDNNKSENRNLDSIVNDLRKKLEQKEEVIDDLREQILMKNNIIRSIEKQVSDQKALLKKFEEHSAVNVVEKDRCTQQLRQAEVMIQEWQQKYDGSKAKVKKENERNDVLSQQVNQQIKVIESAKKDITHYKKSQEKQSEDIERLKNEYVQLKQEQKKIEIVISERNKMIEEVSKRLTEEMSHKISADERALENVNVKNRPMNIAAEYEMLCSNEWHDAKGILDDMCEQLKEEDKIKLLRFIFEASEQECSSHLNMLMSQFERMMKEPMEEEQRLSSVASTSLETDIPIQIKVYLGDYWREKADKANTFKLVQKVLSKARSEYKVETSAVFEDKKFKTFVEASVNLAWKMVLQRPPMTFVQDGIGGKWQGDNKQEVFWSSSDPENPLSKVKYYVHPALHHAESLMVKGRVYLSQT